MPFDVLVHINEDSHRGRVIRMMADAQHVTPDEVVEQIIDAGIQGHIQPAPQSTNGKGPAHTLLGLFSSPEDSALMDEVTTIEYEGRRAATTRDIGA
ncbi:MAG: hypothetical protein ACLQVD_12255 [Capsulimonadaceae bacterium]